MIDKNTYYKLPSFFRNGAISVSRAKSGRYLLTATDKAKGYYVTLENNGIKLNVPFRALFETNSKVAPIKSLSFISAIDCPSHKMGFCQLKDGNVSCYAKNGQLRACGTYTKSGMPCINSQMASDLVSECIDHIKQYGQSRALFKQYIRETVPIIRFNLKGDFRDESDIYFLFGLAISCPDTVFYGYTARDDLLDAQKIWDKIDCLNNFVLNGSNMTYSNRFKVTYDIMEFMASNRSCIGKCSICGNCLEKGEGEIICLLHNKSSDNILKTVANCQSLAIICNYAHKLKIDPFILYNAKGGLFEVYKKLLRHKGVHIEATNFVEYKAEVMQTNYLLPLYCETYLTWGVGE